jgi:TP901 family phage tail tape measure protein
MAKIREELEIVSSDDLNSLLNRLNKLKDEIKDTNNTTVKPKTDSSEIDKANIKLDNLRKNAQSGIDAKVNVQLDASDLKKLNNLPTAKAKVDFLVNKGTISKSIGKDLQAAIGKAYSDVSRKFKDFPGLDKEPNISLDNFMKRVPELSARQRSGIIQTLTDKGIISDKNIPESYETVYRLKSYLENAKKAVSKTIPSEAFTAPDLSLSATEYGNAINEQVKLVQNVLNASKFFVDLSSKMNVKAAAKVSPEEMYKLMGVGSEKADTGNYVAYLADQIAKKANVYDIIDQVVTGALDPTQISQKDIANSISKITKKKESTPKASSTGKTKKKVKPVIDDSDDSDRPEGNIEKLYDELKDAYKNFVEARKARKTNSIHPSDYALKSAVFREAYAKVAPHLFDDEKEKFVGPKPMSQEVAQLAADSTRKTVEQIYSIKKPLKDLGYLGNNPDVSKIFDRISNRIIKINADKLNNRDNENGDTDEIIKNIGVMNKLASQLEDMIHADGHVDFAIKNLPTITKPATTASSLLDNSDIKKQTEETADAITRTADQVIDAKSKEADAVVAANDKIAESEKKVTNQVTDAAKEQNDTIKTVFGLKNVNSNLTETPVTPPELDGLKQLSQREFGDAQKYIKVYEDTNRTIYTLTQTYKKQFDANGNLLAEGYENAIAYYDSYEKLEGEAVKLSKKINSNYAKLDTEKYKSTDKQNPNLLKKLQDNIKSDQQDLSELHRIARLNASLPDNDYMYQNFTQALRKGSAESARSLSATRKTNRDNFNVKKDTLNTDISKQISDIESLGQAGTIAAGKLQGIQKSLSTITTPAGLENIQKQITDINEQFDSNKARESALNYVHNLEQGLTGKQNVVIGTKNASDNFTGSIKDGKWIGPLAGLNSKFESTSAKLDGYIADAKKLGDVGEKAADSFSTLKENLKTCYTESGLKQIQGDMKVTQAQLTASKKQADAIKNSDIAKQYDNAIDKAKEVKSLNAELLGYKKKQSQYSEGSDTYTEIGNRITETAEAAKKANTDFERLTQNDFVSKNSEALKNAGKNVEDYDKVVREMKQAQADVSGFDEKTIQANNKEAFTEQYTKAIEKVKELKSAMQDLYSFEAKGAKGQISSDDFISGFTDRFKNIKKLKENVDEFKKNTYQNNKDDADSVLNQLLFGNYEKAFTDSEQSMSDYENKITTLMTQAYSRQRKLSNDLYKMAGNKNYSEQEYTEKMNQRNGVQATYEALKAQIKNSGKNIDSDSLISDIKKASDLDRNSILGNLKESLSSQINDFENSLKHMQNTMNLPDGIASLKEKLESAFTFENGADNLGNFKNRMQDFYQTFDSLKGSSFIQFANEFGTAFDSLTKAENSSGKVSAYTDKLNGFVESYNDIVTRFHNKEIDTSKAQDEISELASKMQDFQKVAKNYDKTNSKGTYLEGTKGLVQDTKDVETMLTEYANSIGLTSKISSSINETTGQVKMQFADISGNVVTLTGNLEKAGNAMRIISSTASKASTGMSSFGTSIKGMVSGNFKGAIADIASYVSYFQVTMKAIQQAKQGFNDFLNFQKDLTNVSYTMNLSPDQLQNLGTSAIDMAKDLSMSLDNTMDIYKIYANMNTTASEIQETAKPTAILSNLSGVDASTAADQVQGILQQFHMLEDGSTTAADASMHIVDVLDKVSGSVGIDYAKGIKIISDAVQASGQVAYDAGMSYEQLAAITAKVSERTREDGSSIGNALKTIITRTTKVGKMPQYADEVDNATLSNASASLHAIGVDVYNPDGSDRGIITVMSELKDKWDDLTDAQQAKIAFDVAATRQTSKFKSMLDAFTDSMSLAEEATTANGNAEANQEKYMESTAGKLQAIKTQMQDFWVNFYNSGTVNGVLEFVHSLTEGFTSLEKTLGPIPALLTAVFAAMTVKNATMAGLKFLSGGGLATVVG